MEYTLTFSEMELYDLIQEDKFSVFDIPFEIRTEDPVMYSLELHKAAFERKKLDGFLKRAMEDIKNAPNKKFSEDLLERISPYFPGGNREFDPELAQVDGKIVKKELSVFELPFNFRVKYPVFYSTELYTVRSDRRQLNAFLKRAQEDLTQFPEGIQKFELESRLAPYLPGGKREFYPEFGELCDR